LSSLDRAAALLTDAVARTGPLAPAVLFGASFVEYVFPPFPGDTVVLLGAWYAVHGALSWPSAFAAVTAGAVAGAWVDWRIGRALAPALEARAAVRGPLDAERLARFDAAYRKYGGLLLVANRFFPGIRAFLFVAAGAARLPLGRVLLLGGLSAALWNILLLAVGALLVRNVGDMVAFFERYTVAAWWILGLAAAGLALRLLVRRKRGAR
jgi:membrane protein DedA with SNARE-associated domain